MVCTALVAEDIAGLTASGEAVSTQGETSASLYNVDRGCKFDRNGCDRLSRDDVTTDYHLCPKTEVPRNRVVRRRSQQRVMYLHCTLLLTGGAPGSHTTGVLGFCTGFNNVPGSTHEVLQVKAIVGNYSDFKSLYCYNQKSRTRALNVESVARSSDV